MKRTQNGKQIMGTWHVDGFNTSSIITPIWERGYQNCTRWKTVKQCASREEAEKECEKHNNQPTT